MYLYPEIPKNMIKLKWSRNRTSDLYKNGFKYCGECVFMIKINESHCRRCGRIFRSRPRSASNLYKLVTESIDEPITIRLRRAS